MIHLAKATKVSGSWSILLGGAALAKTFPKAVTDTGIDVNQAVISISTGITSTILFFVIFWILSAATKRHPITWIKFGESVNTEIRGKKGWLLFFIINLLVLAPAYSIIYNAADLGSVIAENKILHDLYPFEAYTQYYLVLIGAIAILYISAGITMAFGHTEASTKYTTWILWITAIGAPIFGSIILPGIVYGGEHVNQLGFAVTTIANAYSATFLTLYLQKSIRVKNTYPANLSIKTVLPISSRKLVKSDSVVSDIQITDTPNLTSVIHENKTTITKSTHDTPVDRTVIDDTIYEEAWNELESGNIEKGLWARCYAELDGDDRQTKAMYLKLRAERLKADHLEKEDKWKKEKRDNERQKERTAIAVKETSWRQQYETKMKNIRESREFRLSKEEIDSVDHSGNTYLSRSILSKKPDDVALLLAHGANPNIKNGENLSPLDLAKLVAVPVIVDSIDQAMKYHNEVWRQHSISELRTAIDLLNTYPAESLENVLLAVKGYIVVGNDINEPNEYGFTPLYKAIKDNNFAITHALILLGANPNQELYGKSMRGFMELSENRDIRELATSISLHQHSALTAKVLIDIALYLEVNPKTSTSNLLQMIENEFDVKRLHLRERIEDLHLDTNALSRYNDNNQTPLMEAILKEDLDLVGILLEMGANPKLESNGTTTLGLAKSTQNKDIISMIESSIESFSCSISAN